MTLVSQCQATHTHTQTRHKRWATQAEHALHDVYHDGTLVPVTRPLVCTLCTARLAKKRAVTFATTLPILELDP